MQFRRPAVRPLWLGVVAAVVVLGGAGAGYALASSSGQPTVTTRATVARGTVTTSAVAAGTLAVSSRVSLNFGVPGTITAITVKPGDRVTPGQPLATVQTADAARDVATAARELDEARHILAAQRAKATVSGTPAGMTLQSEDQASLDLARQALTADGQTVHSDFQAVAKDCVSSGDPARCSAAQTSLYHDQQRLTLQQAAVVNAQDTYGTDIMPTADAVVSVTWNQRQSMLSEDEMAVTQASQNLTAARQELAGTTLRAPAAGVVRAVHGAVGQLAVAVNEGTDRLWSRPSGAPSPTAAPNTGDFIELDGVHAPSITVPVPANHIGAVRAGQPATVSFVNAAGRGFGATVTDISPVRTTGFKGVAAYQVTLWPNGPLPAGAPTRGQVLAQITTAQVDDAVYVPSGAIQHHGGNHEVTVVSGGTGQTVVVWPGYYGTRYVQVLRGLTPGQTVLAREPADNPSDAATPQS